MEGIYVDVANQIIADSAGNAYVVGTTNSPDFPITPGAYQTLLAGGYCGPDQPCGSAFVAKLNSTGTALIFSTFLGGPASGINNNVAGSQGHGIALDSGGNVYVTGQTISTGFPTTANAYQPQYPSGANAQAFVTELSPDGSQLLYSTLFGGHSPYLPTLSFGIRVDATGSISFSGWTEDPTMPVTPTAYQGTLAGGADIFVAKKSIPRRGAPGCFTRRFSEAN